MASAIDMGTDSADVTVTNKDKVDEEDEAYNAVYDSQLRGFVRRVYAILATQLILTTGLCALITFCQPVNDWILSSQDWSFYLWFFGSLITMVGAFYYRQKFPYNYVFLYAFTVCESVLIGAICALYNEMGAGDTVVQAACFTVGIFVGLTIFTWQSKIDFSFMRCGIMTCLLMMIMWGCLVMINGYIMSQAYCAVGAVLFCFIIIWDTSRLSALFKHDPDMWVVASITLYLDFVNLFLYILALLAGRR